MEMCKGAGAQKPQVGDAKAYFFWKKKHNVSCLDFKPQKRQTDQQS